MFFPLSGPNVTTSLRNPAPSLCSPLTRPRSWPTPTRSSTFATTTSDTSTPRGGCPSGSVCRTTPSQNQGQLGAGKELQKDVFSLVLRTVSTGVVAKVFKFTTTRLKNAVPGIENVWGPRTVKKCIILPWLVVKLPTNVILWVQSNVWVLSHLTPRRRLSAGSSSRREIETLSIKLDEIMLGSYKHFMEKEIHEQPESLRKEMAARCENLLDHLTCWYKGA